jgi:hypothetical protein
MGIHHGRGLSPWGRRDEPRRATRARRKVLLALVRYGIPLSVFVAGIVVLAVGRDRDAAVESGFMFFGVALAVLLLNLFFRIGVRGDRERDREEEARRYFDRHGRWPDP